MIKKNVLFKKRNNGDLSIFFDGIDFRTKIYLIKDILLKNRIGFRITSKRVNDLKEEIVNH